MVVRYALPTMIRRGVATLLTVNVYDEAGALQTAGVATITVLAGATEIVSAANATKAGPETASYSLAAPVTSALALADDWQVIWDLTIGGTAYSFRVPAYLVLRELYPVITDADLTELHSDLGDLRDPDQTTYEAQRGAAWTRVNQWLIAKGNRPQLILDSWALRDVHRFLALELIFRDFALSVGDGRYADLADHYRTEAREAFDALQFRYDADEDGAIDDSDTRAAVPVIYLSGSRWY